MGRLLAGGLQRGRLLAGGPRHPQSMHPHKYDETGHGYSTPCHPESRAKCGHSASYQTEISHLARRCYHAAHDITPIRGSHTPTMGCRYGPQATGPTYQQGARRRRALTSRLEERPAPNQAALLLLEFVRH